MEPQIHPIVTLLYPSSALKGKPKRWVKSWIELGVVFLFGGASGIAGYCRSMYVGTGRAALFLLVHALIGLSTERGAASSLSSVAAAVGAESKIHGDNPSHCIVVCGSSV